MEGHRRDNGVRFNKANVTIVKEGSVRRLARKLTRVGGPVVSRYYAGNSCSRMALGEREGGCKRTDEFVIYGAPLTRELFRVSRSKARFDRSFREIS